MNKFISCALSLGLALAIPSGAKAEIIEIDRADVIEALEGCPAGALKDYSQGLRMIYLECTKRALEAIGCTNPSLGRALTCMRVANGMWEGATRGGGVRVGDLEVLLSGYSPEAPADLPIMGIAQSRQQFDPEGYFLQHGLILLECSERPLDGSVLPEEMACFRTMFNLPGKEMTAPDLSRLRAAGQYTNREDALASLAREGYRLPPPPTTSVARTAPERSPTPRLSSEPRPIGEAFAPGSPTDADMQEAMENHFITVNAMLLGIQGSCDSFRRQENPFTAMACLASAAMGMDGQAVGVRVVGIDATECMLTQDDTYLCEVGVQLDSNMGNNPYVRASMALYANNQRRPILFERVGGEWTVEQLYTECTYTDDGADCTYLERR